MMLAFAGAAALGTFGLVLLDVWRTGERHHAYLVAAIWLRYALSAFPDITTPPLMAGLSISALATLGVACLGALVVAPRSFLNRWLVPFYLLVAIVVFSGLANGTANGIVIVCIRLVYLLVLQLALYNAAMRLGIDRVVRSLILVFCLPVSLQWFSIVFDIEKLHGVTLAPWQDLEIIGRNYVGSYEHESTMSIMLVTFLVVLSLSRTRSPVFWACLALAVVGLHFSNYRTVTLAGVPVILAILATRFLGAFNARSRLPALALVAGLAIPVIVVALADGRLIERFQDVGAVSELDLTQETYRLTQGEREVFTGRYYIWVEYISAWRGARLAQQLIGFGPESWKGNFFMYAHNLYISTLYEFGLIGLFVLLFYFMSLLANCLRIADPTLRFKLLAGYAGFAIMSMATMPMWKIEGLVLLAILNGATMYLAARSQAEASIRRLRWAGHAA